MLASTIVPSRSRSRMMIFSNRAPTREQMTEVRMVSPPHRLDLVEHVLHTRITVHVSITDNSYGLALGPPWDRRGGYALLSDPTKGIRLSMRSRNISRRVLRFLPSYSRSANVGWSIASFTPNILSLLSDMVDDIPDRLAQSIPQESALRDVLNDDAVITSGV